jgi:hypothetical protein
VPAAIQRIHAGVEALQMADKALADVRGMVASWIEGLANAEDGSAEPVSRFGPEIRAVDERLRSARQGDMRLFDGAWELVIDGTAGTEPIRFELPAMDTACLGDLRVGSLADLAAADQRPQRTRPAAARFILDGAVRQIDAQRRRIAAFIQARLSPHLSRLQSILENLSSVRGAVDDADFVVAIGRLNRIQILMNARPQPAPSKKPGALRIRRT